MTTINPDPSPQTQDTPSAVAPIGPVVIMPPPTLSAALMALSPNLHAKLTRQFESQRADGHFDGPATMDEFLHDALYAYAWGLL